MSVSFRIDDVCPEMDWERLECFLAMLMEFNIKPLLGVVPNNEDPTLKRGKTKTDFWDKILELQAAGYVIAMHGYDHVYITDQCGIFPINTSSEFAGLPYDEQLLKIKAGKEIFEKHNIQTNVFMAPAHSFDEYTIKALKEFDFKYITDGFARKKYQRKGLVFMPICNSIRRIGRLSKKWDNVTVVVHTNGMNDAMIERYRNECKKLRTGQLVSYSQLMEGVPQFCYDNLVERKLIIRDEKTEVFALKLLGMISYIKTAFKMRRKHCYVSN